MQLITLWCHNVLITIEDYTRLLKSFLMEKSCSLFQVGDPDPHLVLGRWTEVGPRGH